MLSLVKSEVESTDAVGSVLTGAWTSRTRVRFANGCIVNLTASHSRDRVRRIRFFQPATYLSIDYAAQRWSGGSCFERGRPASIQGCGYHVVNEEPPKRELAISWTRWCHSSAGRDRTGRRALALAQQITEMIAGHWTQTEMAGRAGQDCNPALLQSCDMYGRITVCERVHPL